MSYTRRPSKIPKPVWQTSRTCKNSATGCEKNTEERHEKVSTYGRIVVAVTTEETPVKLLRSSAANQVLVQLKSKILRQKYSLGNWVNLPLSLLNPEVSRLYEWNLKKKAFSVWKSHWWQHRNLWVLVIRAKCHDRVRKLRFYFRAWKRYVGYKNVKRGSFQMADLHYKKVLMMKALRKIKAYNDYKITTRKMKKVAELWHHRFLVTRYLMFWRKELALKKVEKGLDVHLKLVHDKKILRRVMTCWHKHVLMKKLRVKISKEIELCYNVRLERRAFASWRKWIDLQRLKTEQKHIAIQMYGHNLCKSVWKTWRTRLFQVRRIFHLMTNVLQLQQKRFISICFQAWHEYALMKQRLEIYELKAESYYKCKLKSTSFKKLQVFLLRQQTKRQNAERIGIFRQHSLLLKTWKKWQLRLEDKEEEGLHDKYAVAYNQYRYYLIKRHMELWEMYIVLQKRKLDMKCEADSFRKRIVITRCLEVWSVKWKEKQYINSLESKANFFCRRILLKSMFTTWKKNVNEKLEEDGKDKIAVNFWMQLILSKTLRKWIYYVEENEVKKENKAAAEKFYHRTTRLYYFQLWTQHLTESQKFKIGLEKATLHYHFKIKQRALKVWMLNHRWWSLVELHIAFVASCIAKEYLQLAFCLWRQYFLRKKQRKALLLKAVLFHERAVKRKCLQDWKKYVTEKVKKRTWMQQRIENAKKHLNRVRLQDFFTIWVNKYEEQLSLKRKKSKADDCYKMQVLRKFFALWLLYHEKQELKRALTQRASDFRRTHTLLRVVDFWQQQLEEKLLWNAKKEKALLHWSNSLKSKVFLNWLKYKCHRGIKKSVQTRILETRHQFLLKEAVKAWIAEGMRLCFKREQAVLWRTAQEVMRKSSLALKYCQLWRFKVAQRKAWRKETAIASRPLSFAALSQRMPAPSQVESFENTRVQPRIPDFIKVKLGALQEETVTPGGPFHLCFQMFGGGDN